MTKGIVVNQVAETKVESSAKPTIKESEEMLMQNPINESDKTESLNDIRFGNWTEKDWLDNDYFRALRKYINDYLQGKVENNDLVSYRSILKSEFVIYNVEPFIAGGLFVSVLFLDDPNIIFDAWIYSDVDVTTRKVISYHVNGLNAREDEYSSITKEDVLTIIKEHPENKLW